MGDVVFRVRAIFRRGHEAIIAYSCEMGSA